MKKISTLVLSLIFVGMMFFLIEKEVMAEDGGMVQTTGEIGFYEEKTLSSTSSQESTSAESTSKPRGTLPSTGEIIGKSLLVVSFILLLILIFLGITRYRKRGKL